MNSTTISGYLMTYNQSGRQGQSEKGSCTDDLPRESQKEKEEKVSTVFPLREKGYAVVEQQATEHDTWNQTCFQKGEKSKFYTGKGKVEIKRRVFRTYGIQKEKARETQE